MKKTILFLIVSCLFATYIHAQGAWRQRADFGGSARLGAVGYSISDKGYIGTGLANGFFSGTVACSDLWEYDKTTNTWTQKNSITQERYYATGFAIGTKGYIGTGDYGNYLNDFWEYNSSNNLWTQRSNVSSVTRESAVGFSIGTKGYIGTGFNPFQTTMTRKDFWEYNPADNTWSQKADFGGVGRYEAVGFSISNKGYIGLGTDESSNKLNDFWEYDPALNTWTQKASLSNAISGATGFSIGSVGYVGSGFGNGTYLSDFYKYSPSTNTWTTIQSMPGARVHSTSFTIGNRGYVGTGEAGSSKLNDFWEYIPVPANQAWNISVPTTAYSSGTISWANGDGEKRVVFLREDLDLAYFPVNGTTYVASADWSSKGTQIGATGWYCVYNGTGNSVSLSNLTWGQTYKVLIKEYNGDSGWEQYETYYQYHQNADDFTTLKLTQTLSAMAWLPKTYGNSDFDPGSTASSGLPVIYSSSDLSIATIVGGLVHIVGAGTCTIYCNQLGNAMYYSAPETSKVLTVSKRGQSITSALIPTKHTTDVDFDLAWTSSSGLPVTYSSSNASIATIVNGKIHITGDGTCTIYANQSGNSNYNPATETSQSLTVYKLNQDITTSPIPNQDLGVPDFDPGWTSTSGLPLTYFSYDPAVATIINNKVHIVGSGTVLISGRQHGNFVYYEAANSGVFMTVKKPSIITIDPIPDKLLTSIDFPILQNSTNNNTSIVITLSNPLVATLIGSFVHIVGAGTCIVYANQAGDTEYMQAQEVSVTFNVLRTTQSISFGLSSPKYCMSDQLLFGTATSGLPIVYTSSDETVATIVAGKIHPVGSGTCTIYANQPGNDSYYAAPEVSRQLTIDKANQTIGSASYTKTYGDVDFAIAATSGLPVSFVFSDPSIATVVNDKIHILKGGTCTITATQAGDNCYNPASRTITLTVNKRSLTIRALNNISVQYSKVPPYTYSYMGWAPGESLANSDITGTPVAITTYTTATPRATPGITYTASVASMISSNYSFIVDPMSRSITVMKLPQILTFNSFSANYGDADFLPPATSNGTIIPITFTSSNPAVATIVAGKVHIVGAGTSTITAIQAGDVNQFAATKARPLTVTKKALTVTADNLSRLYNAANPTLTYQISGFVNGEVATVINVLPTISTTADISSLPGDYPITMSGASDNCYSFVYSSGVLSVLPEETNWNGTAWDNGVPTATKQANIAGNYNEATGFVCYNLNILAGNVLNINGIITVNNLLTNNGTTDNLVVKPVGMLLHNTNNVDGALELSLTGNVWHYVSSPVQNQAVSLFTVAPGGFTNPNFYVYNETNSDAWDALGIWSGTSGWTPQPAGTMFSNNGYCFYYTAPNVYKFAGKFHNGNYSISLTNTASSFDTKYDGWNLVGNPYPSALDWELVTKTGVANSIYYYNGVNYTYYISSGVNQETSIGVNVDASTNGRYIPVCQGFMVKCLNPTGQLDYSNAARTQNTQSFFKSGKNNVVRLSAIGNSYKDETVIRFLNDALPEYDGSYDANKFFSANKSVPQIYSLTNNGNELAINSLPLISATGYSVALGFNAKSGAYTVSASELNFDFSSKVYLYDKVENSFTNLSEKSYTFTHVGGDVRNRFSIVFDLATQLSNTNLQNQSIRVWAFHKTVFVSFSDQSDLNNNALFHIYDMTGRKVWEKKTGEMLKQNGSVISFETGLVAGAYLVKIGGESIKIVIGE